MLFDLVFRLAQFTGSVVLALVLVLILGAVFIWCSRGIYLLFSGDRQKFQKPLTINTRQRDIKRKWNDDDLFESIDTFRLDFISHAGG